MNVWSRIVRFVTDEHVLFAPDGAGRTFVVCYHCRRVVPAWRLVSSQPTQMGCRCGSGHVRPAVISTAQAYWWVFVRGLLLRRVLGHREWDPRLPVRV